jgi:hypothetical protein
MSIAHTVTEVLREHITLEVESIDRMYLNVYVPQLQHERGVVAFFRQHRGATFASSALMAPMTHAFVKAMDDFIKVQKIPVVRFMKGQRKDEITAEYLKQFGQEEGILYIGKAQEKVNVFRTEKRRNPVTGQSYPWIVRSTALVNQYYIYAVDRDFGPFFLKFSSYFPYNARLCINGHDYAKRQLMQRGIAFESLDNGFLTCADPAQLQTICDALSAEQIDGLLRKWLARLPHPFTAEDRAAGYRYDLSMLQTEFSLTQVLDRPLMGRILFEDIIRENLDLGRPDQVQLIFQRRVTKRTPGRFRTRIITEGVIPSLHIDYKSSRIKQYFKEGRALRTETTINNTYDFAIGKRLANLPDLRQVGFAANRRLLDVQSLSHDCALGEDAFQKLNRPVEVNQQRAAALRFADPTVQALLSLLLMFCLLPHGFRNRDLRRPLAALLGEDPNHMTQGRMTYHLRRLRLHGLIQRIHGTHAYRLTPEGIRTAFFFTRTYARILRPGMAFTMTLPSAAQSTRTDSAIQHHFSKLDAIFQQSIDHALLAA